MQSTATRSTESHFLCLEPGSNRSQHKRRGCAPVWVIYWADKRLSILSTLFFGARRTSIGCVEMVYGSVIHIFYVPFFNMRSHGSKPVEQVLLSKCLFVSIFNAEPKHMHALDHKKMLWERQSFAYKSIIKHTTLAKENGIRSWTVFILYLRVRTVAKRHMRSSCLLRLLFWFHVSNYRNFWNNERWKSCIKYFSIMKLFHLQKPLSKWH